MHYRTVVERAVRIVGTRVTFEQNGEVYATTTFTTQDTALSAAREWLGIEMPDHIAEADAIHDRLRWAA
jgi:hypothetical protein